VITYDYGWTSHEINSLLSVRPESVVMVILMEYCNLKSLASNIRQTNRFGHQSGELKWTHIAHTLIDILRGLTYLHDMEIIHGDIKAANVMLKSVHKSVTPCKFTAKLADLGLAQLRGDAVSPPSTPVVLLYTSSIHCKWSKIFNAWLWL
jgi:serine/threonine protein kinase